MEFQINLAPEIWQMYGAMTAKWYYQVMGEVRGPIDDRGLRRLVERNEISRDSYVRREGLEWTTADRIESLFDPLAGGPKWSEDKMYYQIMGEIRGPVSPSTLRRLAASNDINRDTFVRRDGEDWMTADCVHDLLN